MKLARLVSQNLVYLKKNRYPSDMTFVIIIRIIIPSIKKLFDIVLCVCGWVGSMQCWLP